MPSDREPNLNLYLSGIYIKAPRGGTLPIRYAFAAFAAVTFAALTASAQQTPTPAAAPWWKLTTELANDEMQGRDTGTEAYERAAKLVAAHFQADGLKPAGDNGTFFQRVPMHQVDLDTAHSSVELVSPDGSYTPLALLYDVTLAPRADLPPFTEGQLVFVGYGEKAPPDLKGKIAVYFNGTPADLTPEQRSKFVVARLVELAQSGVAGMVSIDNPAAIEPSHWPAAYARTVTLAGTPQRPIANAPVTLRISAESAAKLFAGTDANPAKILADAAKGLPLPTLPLARKLRIRIEDNREEHLQSEYHRGASGLGPCAGA